MFYKVLLRFAPVELITGHAAMLRAALHLAPEQRSKPHRSKEQKQPKSRAPALRRALCWTEGCQHLLQPGAH